MLGNLTQRLSDIFGKLRGKGRLTEADVKAAMKEIKFVLIEADVSYKVVKQFVDAVTSRAIGSDVLESLTPAQQVVKIVNEELCGIMGSTNTKINFASQPPTVILMAGLQGAGKTTHVGKLALYMKKHSGKRPLMVACDVYRPAAIKQLEVVGEKVGVPVFQMGQGDPVKIARAGVEHAKREGYDVVFIDTAGRLHIDPTMMEELKQIKAAVDPTATLLVIDAMTGQDAVNAADSFNKEVELTGVILTKLDGDTRGGAALSVRAVTGKPILYIGTGEKPEDIEPFYPDRMASRILDMGDVLTLIDKAQSVFDEKQAAELEKKMRQNAFDLQDFLNQMRQMKEMGGIEKLMGMLPGVNAGAMKNFKVDEKDLKRTEAIILSMTPKERADPDIINSSRKKRIAAGCGVRVEDVNRLLKQFGESRKMLKMFSGDGKLKKSGKKRFPFFR